VIGDGKENGRWERGEVFFVFSPTFPLFLPSLSPSRTIDCANKGGPTDPTHHLARACFFSSREERKRREEER